MTIDNDVNQTEGQISWRRQSFLLLLHALVVGTGLLLPVFGEGALFGLGLFPNGWAIFGIVLLPIVSLACLSYALERNCKTAKILNLAIFSILAVVVWAIVVVAAT
jgi:hypothetical protein